MEFPKLLPGGNYTISDAENASLCAAVGAVSDADGRAHPIFHYIAAQCAMGVSVAELLEMCDFDVADGPMIARSEVIFQNELRVGRDYRVSGEIVSLVRKPSRTFGTIDQLTFRLEIAEPDGTSASAMTHHWVLPRGLGGDNARW